LAFFFEALAALRFFAMSVTSFLDKILHARRTLSKEILTTKRDQAVPANIAALSVGASENNSDTQRHAVAQTRRPCADRRARFARRRRAAAVHRRGAERASTANLTRSIPAPIARATRRLDAQAASDVFGIPEKSAKNSPAILRRRAALRVNRPPDARRRAAAHPLAYDSDAVGLRPAPVRANNPYLDQRSVVARRARTVAAGGRLLPPPRAQGLGPAAKKIFKIF
jgi:hypothetical protein